MSVTSLERLGTGDPAFDRNLGGGLPLRFVTLLAGQPVAGATVLAHHMLIQLARRGKPGTEWHMARGRL